MQPHLTANDERKLWLSRRHGIGSRVARDLGFTVAYVLAVYYGRQRSKTGDIERAFAEAGAPWFSEFKSTQGAAVAAND